ncbi:MAG: Asp-tRNA(Asn)/Glu-tRNA(Gln) amidotransferase subunit GatC [Longimicrobiales bacterium]
MRAAAAAQRPVTITDAEIRAIAALARLRLEDDELRTLTAELNTILAHADALTEVGADDGPTSSPAAQVQGGVPAAPLRPDSGAADALVRPLEQLAPDWCAGFFVVPRMEGLGGGEADEPNELP